MEILEESGAAGREAARWPEKKGMRESKEEMESWVRRRIAFLDDYYSG